MDQSLESSDLLPIKHSVSGHFKSVSAAMEKMITDWRQKEGDDGVTKAASLFYKAINSSRTSFEDYLRDLRRERVDDNVIKLLDTLSIYSTASFENNDPMAKDVNFANRTVRLSDDDLRSRVGSFFRKISSDFLREKYPDFYEAAASKFHGRSAVANDSGAAATTSNPSRSPSPTGGDCAEKIDRAVGQLR